MNARWYTQEAMVLDLLGWKTLSWSDPGIWELSDSLLGTVATSRLPSGYDLAPGVTLEHARAVAASLWLELNASA